MLKRVFSSRPLKALPPQKKSDKVGSLTLLDKQWAEKPQTVISNPHKLSEVELYRALEKVVELPEARLRTMLKSDAYDEVFMANLAKRIPHFLTATLVNLTKALLVKKDAFRDHPIWMHLEGEIYRRRAKLNNEQLAQVMQAFAMTGNGSTQFYNEMESLVIDSPILIETEHLLTILNAYAQVD